MKSDEDLQFMLSAIALGQRNLGRTWPNPSVGCVIVKDGAVVGRGQTQPGGRPHAETVAIGNAGDACQGATVYVSLEPCAHFGKAPPCSQALIAARVKRVVAAMIDPDPRVDGKGAAKLRDAGIEVEIGVGETEARRLHAGYIMRQKANRPAFTLKLAQSLDGRIATSSGQSQWITGPQARRYAHLLRARNDAILIGSQTAIADDPTLDCRLEGLETHSPVRIILDRRCRLDPASRLAQTASKVPVWLITADENKAKAAPLEALGVKIFAYPEDGLSGVARLLGDQMLTTVMIEGGGTLAASFIREDLIDRLDVVIARMMLGGDGISSVAELGIDHVDHAPRWQLVHECQLGEDRLTVLEKRRQH